MRIVGIDLGTTHSLVGYVDKGRVHLVPGDDGSNLVPSVVSFDDAGNVTAVGAQAKRARTQNQNVIYSAKRFLGRGKKDVEKWSNVLPFDFSKSDDKTIAFSVGNRTYSPVDVSYLVLRKLKDLAEKDLKDKVHKAVVTVPAYFDDAQRSATKLAGELAGLEVVRIINEPTAACLAYGLDKKAKGVVAVFDLGGGTFDISILRISDGIIEVLATNGDTALGGDDFDHEIVNRIAVELCSFREDNHALSETPADSHTRSSRERAKLILEAERVKKELSENDSAVFAMPGDKGSLCREISRAEFESWVSSIASRVKTPCEQCVKDAGISNADITDVILVGGSTRIPIVRKIAREIFARDPICTINPDEVVAMGAAIQANILAGQMGDMLLLDVVPLSLGIETMGGVVNQMIHRNTTIPVSASQLFTTYVDGQVSVDIHVLQGERELVEDSRSLARFQLKGLPPMPAGIPRIEVEFIIDANGILNVKASELRTSQSASVEVNPSYGLSQEEIEKRLSESLEYAESDFQARFQKEAQIEADSLIRMTRKSLMQGEHLLAASEKTAIENAVLDLEESRATNDYKVIRLKMDALSEIARPFAERLMNYAVAEVLKGQTLGAPGDNKP